MREQHAADLCCLYIVQICQTYRLLKTHADILNVLPIPDQLQHKDKSPERNLITSLKFLFVLRWQPWPIALCSLFNRRCCCCIMTRWTAKHTLIHGRCMASQCMEQSRIFCRPEERRLIVLIIRSETKVQISQKGLTKWVHRMADAKAP